MATAQAEKLGLFYLVCGSGWSVLASWELGSIASEGEHDERDDRVGKRPSPQWESPG
jgi:hypothetical protein